VALTGGRPALAPNQVPSLVDANGALPPRPDGLARARASEIRAEVAAQVELFESLVGRPPTHLDSHHHVHRQPHVLAAVADQAQALGCPVRRASETVASALGALGVPTTDHFEDGFYDAGATLAGLLGILERLPAGCTELMCHPAVVDDELRRGSSYALPRAAELAVLTDPQVRAALARLQIELCDFRDL
jgi:predicted glycoside hydrolase/deacetylase ChbG (UPF0249 family)